LQNTAWTKDLTLSGFATYQANGGTHPFSDLTAITIFMTVTESSDFNYDNDSNSSPALPTGFTVNYQFSATAKLAVPTTAIPTPVITSPAIIGLLSKNASQIVAPDPNGDGAGANTTGIADYTGPDGFTDTLTDSKVGVYNVPSGDFSQFAGTTFPLKGNAVSLSSFTTSTGTQDSLRVNQAGATITVQFAFVPESSALSALVPGVLLVGLFAFYKRNQASSPVQKSC
jgi:hypothetical protein